MSSEYERMCADWERLKAKEEAVIREAHTRTIRNLEAEIARLRPLTVRSATCCEACAPMDRTLREALAKVAAFEARLAEAAPVVEAAELFLPYLAQNGDYHEWGPRFYGSHAIDATKWGGLLSALRAARVKREASGA